MKHKCDGCKYRGEHQEMMFSPMGVCCKEHNLIKAAEAFNAKECPYKKNNENDCAITYPEFGERESLVETLERLKIKFEELGQSFKEIWHSENDGVKDDEIKHQIKRN